MNTSIKNPSLFNQGSWVVLLLAVGFIVFATANVLLAFGQPTDGWYYQTRLDGQWITGISEAGNPGPLQPGDVVLAVNGTPVPPLITHPAARPANWKIGSFAHYTVLRQGQRLDLRVPLVARPASGLWRYYEQGGIASLVIGLAWYLIGFTVFFLRPRDTAARLLLLFTVLWSTNSLIIEADKSANAYYYAPAIFWTHLLLNILWFFLFGLIIHFLLVFPVPHWPLTRRPYLTLAGLYGFCAVTTAMVLVVNRRDPTNAVLGLLLVAVLSTLLTTTIDNVRQRRHPVQRAQVAWLALGIAGPVLGVIIVFPIQSLVPSVDQRVLSLVGGSLSALLPLCLGLAITRYRLFDVYVIIRRTLVYAIVTALLGLVYFGGVTLLQRLFTGLSGQSSPAALVISTLLIAALFNPLRTRIQDFIDRRFYRRKYDAEQALSEFAAAARSETELDLLSDRMLQVASESLQPEFSQLWLVRKSDRFSQTDR